MLTLALFLVGGLMFGVFMGFPSLIPLFRRIGQGNERFRRYLMIGLALLAAFLFYVSGALTLGTSYTRSINCEYSAVEEGTVCEQIRIPGGDTEAVLRTLLPPFLRDICLTGNADICTAIQTEDIFRINPQWLDYIGLVMGSGLAAGICAFFVYYRLQPPASSSRRR